ncbi:MAG: acyl-CoA dehydratase activase [Dehalococcoidia bacterium]|jgi:predicted CoA-substrate-specific enzyme activase|nr:acyl-CoA dehydratase activase [Dehalococcoidia bacterium]
MITAGVDVGAATAKTAIISDGKILSYAVIPTGDSVARAAERVTRAALEQAGLSMADLSFVISTGYGRNGVAFANKTASEIICHAKGVNLLMPAARTVIDIGGQDSKVIGVRENGTVSDFVMNDKCAAGTGRFLEVMAGVLGLDIEEMGPISCTSKEPCPISNTCTIFAETEMVSLRAEGRTREDLVAGIHKAVASRVVVMGKTVGYREQVVFTGGVAKNTGVKNSLEAGIGLPILIPEEPQIMGALGAALLAKAELSRQ